MLSILFILLVLVVVGWVLREAFFQGPEIAPTPLPDGGIIDLHCHCAGLGAGSSGCYLSPEMRRSWKYRLYLRGFGTTETELLKHGDQLGIKRIAELVKESRHVSAAVILALDCVVDRQGREDRPSTIFSIPNEFVARETARYPQLYFGASVHPYRRDAGRRLEWCRLHGARLVKWLPSIQWIDPADPGLEPFYRKLVELDLPLLSHAGDEASFTRALDELADPARLELPLSLGVRVIAAHVGSTGRNGGEDNMDRTVALMARFDNLWADVSALTQINRKRFFQRALATPKIHDRLLYGTDHPLTNMLIVSPWYFPLRLRIGQMLSISRVDNPWDRDVLLKQALGLPASVFRLPAEVLKVAGGSACNRAPDG
ncbi:MAG: amidohydrolase family protein [Acidobacteriota bacterium]